LRNEPIPLNFSRYSLDPKPGVTMKTTRFLISPAAIVSVVALFASSTSAGAQRIASNATLGVSRHFAETRMRDSARVTEKPAYARNTALRFVASAVGSGAGMIAGAYAGASMAGPCGCDDPGLEQVLLGGLGGMIAGASIGAAAPSMSSTCSFGKRLALTAIGSLAGSVAGIASEQAVHSGAILIVLPAATAGGAVMMLGACR
jgi:hypothetical protein